MKGKRVASRCDRCRRVTDTIPCPHCTVDALVHAVATRDNYARAGDILAEMLGHSLAALAAGESFGEERLEAARRGILTWHQLRQIAGP